MLLDTKVNMKHFASYFIMHTYVSYSSWPKGSSPWSKGPHKVSFINSGLRDGKVHTSNISQLMNFIVGSEK